MNQLIHLYIRVACPTGLFIYVSNILNTVIYNTPL